MKKEQEEKLKKEKEAAALQESAAKQESPLVQPAVSSDISPNSQPAKPAETPNVVGDTSKKSGDLVDANAQPAVSTKPDEDDGHLSDEELKRIADALKTMSTDSAFTDVKQTFDELKNERKTFIQVFPTYIRMLKNTSSLQTKNPPQLPNYLGPVSIK